MTNNMTNKAQPAVIILSAPSGAGKTSLARKLVAERDDVALTVSHTTRPMRPAKPMAWIIFSSARMSLKR